MSQHAYIRTILTRFNMLNARPASTPMEPGARFSHNQCPSTLSEIEDMKDVPYAALLGALMYLVTATRPDIAQAVRTLAEYMKNPGRAHWEALKRVLRYLVGTQDLCLAYGCGQTGLVAYSDSDFASQPHRHSISGCVIIMNGGAVIWLS